MVGTPHEKYSQICLIDGDLPHTFLIRTADGDADTTTATTAPTSEATTALYRCICPDPDFADPRTTRSYCPLGYVCGIPQHNNPNGVDCIRTGDGVMNSVVRMAWPVGLVSVGCLFLWLCGTMYGKALYQFLYKAYLKKTLSKLDDNDDDNGGRTINIIDDNNNNNNTNPPPSARTHEQQERDVETVSTPFSSPLEQLEWTEVQSLLDWAAGSTTTTSLSSTTDSASWWTSTSSRPPQPPPAHWWSVQQQKEYLYKLTVLECARKKWRQEWVAMNKSPPPFCLPVKRYDHGTDENDDDDHENNEQTERQGCSVTVKMMTMAGAVDQANSHNEDTTDDDDSSSVAGPTCSICLVDVVHGDKIGDLKCGHIFHSDCLKAWLTTGRNNNCPLCHAPRIATLRPYSVTTSTTPAASKPTRRGKARVSILTSSVVARTTRMTATNTTTTASTTTDESSSVQNSDAEHDHSRHSSEEINAETPFRIPDEGTLNP